MISDAVYDRMESGEFTIRTSEVVDFKTNTHFQQKHVMDGKDTLFRLDTIEPASHHHPMPVTLQPNFATPSILCQPSLGVEHRFEEIDGCPACIIDVEKLSVSKEHSGSIDEVVIDIGEPTPTKPQKPVSNSPESSVPELLTTSTPEPSQPALPTLSPEPSLPAQTARPPTPPASINVLPARPARVDTPTVPMSQAPSAIADKPVAKVDRVGREWIMMAACWALTAVACYVVPLPFLLGLPVGLAYGLWQHYNSQEKEQNYLKDFAITAGAVAGTCLLPSAYYLAAIAGGVAGAQFANLLFRFVTIVTRNA